MGIFKISRFSTVPKIVQIGAVSLDFASENQVVDFIARWRHLCYKFVQYRVNRCVQNKTLLKCTKNDANWSDVLKI